MTGKALYYLGLAPVIIRLGGRRPKVLLFHACEPEEGPFLRGLGSNTTPTDFERQLSFLKRNYRVIAMSELESGQYPDNAVVITFDDGYRSVLENAVPLLARHGFPATVYLVTAVVGNHELVWVNELAWFLNVHPEVAVPIARRHLGAANGERTPELIDRARAGYRPETIRELLGELRSRLNIDNNALASRSRLYLEWDDVRAMARGNTSFGNHTATHPNLGRLTAAAQLEEMRTARDVMLERADLVCTSMAYPFGDHNDSSREAALALGHRSIVEVGGINAPLDLTAVARIPVAARSDAEMFAELEVVAPVKAVLARARAGDRPRHR
jgi:peptidoglycan/xylan/chitin deacetylase (PgdA/CDA1 family)